MYVSLFISSVCAFVVVLTPRHVTFKPHKLDGGKLQKFQRPKVVFLQVASSTEIKTLLKLICMYHFLFKNKDRKVYEVKLLKIFTNCFMKTVL